MADIIESKDTGPTAERFVRINSEWTKELKTKLELHEETVETIQKGIDTTINNLRKPILSSDSKDLQDKTDAMSKIKTINRLTDSLNTIEQKKAFITQLLPTNVLQNNTIETKDGKVFLKQKETEAQRQERLTKKDKETQSINDANRVRYAAEERAKLEAENRQATEQARTEAEAKKVATEKQRLADARQKQIDSDAAQARARLEAFTGIKVASR